MWRTIALSAVNVVTVLTVFTPMVCSVPQGFEEDFYLHSGKAYFFWIQLALGIFAVVIDLFNRREKLQTKLITSGFALSAAFAAIVLWAAFSFDSSLDLGPNTEVRAGAWIPLLNVLLFGAVWVDQRRKMASNK